MKYISFLLFAATLSSHVNAQNLQPMQECVIDKGVLKTVTIDYNSGTGERSMLVNGVRKPFADVYPSEGPGYAAGNAWYINADRVPFKNRVYEKYGLPRILGTTEIVKNGDYKGVGVYTEAGLTGPVDVIYVPVRQGCEFQPYQVYCGRVEYTKSKPTATSMTITAKVLDVKGKISYAWSSDNIRIIKGQGTPKITVDITGKKEDDVFNTTLNVNKSSGCPLSSWNSTVIHR